ncbi:MAG TPA: 5-formyltetrahydrofolate cyclo-ligase [Candidatus Thermoplasmatota archaeon]|nr:5-formyltetrahydrofolate cyclo-ligase [Candidatus Thermoplasmatota archaeon]
MDESPKTLLRKEALARRRAIPERDRRAHGAAIARHVLELPDYVEAGTVAAYVSIGSEVPTEHLLAQILRDGKALAVPVTDPARTEIELHLLTELAHLVPGAHDIPEPALAHRKPLDPASVDLLLVPGVAFDLQGHRLGYGKGYYDRLLRRAPRALKVGLAFETQVVPRIPFEDHDVQLDLLVTETGVHHFPRASLKL